MSKRKKVTVDPTPLTSNPFAGLGTLLPNAPPGPSPDPAPSPAPAPALAGPDLDRRLIVRRQKRGQGGKTVTCVEGLDGEQLPALLRRLKRELGCNGRVDGGILVAGTGDHARVAGWLRELGAAHVTLGN